MKSKEQQDREQVARHEVRKEEAIDVLKKAADAWDKKDVRSLPAPEALEKASQIIGIERGMSSIVCKKHNGHKIIEQTAIDAAKGLLDGETIVKTINNEHETLAEATREISEKKDAGDAASPEPRQSKKPII